MLGLCCGPLTSLSSAPASIYVCFCSAPGFVDFDPLFPVHRFLDFLHHCGGCDLERESEKTAHSGYLDPFPLDPPPWSTIPCLHICNSFFTVNKCTELSSPECAPDSTSPLVLTVQGDDTRVFHMCGYRISYMKLIRNNKYRVEWTVPALKPAPRRLWSIKSQKLPNLL